MEEQQPIPMPLNQEQPSKIREYNPHYLKYREKILANAKAYQKKKQEMLREEKRRKIALEYLQEQLKGKIDSKP